MDLTKDTMKHKIIQKFIEVNVYENAIYYRFRVYEMLEQIIISKHANKVTRLATKLDLDIEFEFRRFKLAPTHLKYTAAHLRYSAIYVVCGYLSRYTTSNEINIPVSTRRRFDVHTTSITLKRRRMDVKTTSCAYWNATDSLLLSGPLFFKVLLFI